MSSGRNVLSAEQRRLRWKLWIGGGAILLTSCLLSLINLHSLFVYQTYQQGMCTIESSNIYKDRSHYTPEFTYILHTKDGHQEEITDEPNGPHPMMQDETLYDAEFNAQVILDRYEVGQSYPCWYNPANLGGNTAVLGHPSYTIDRLLGDCLGTFVASLVMQIIVIGSLAWFKRAGPFGKIGAAMLCAFVVLVGVSGLFFVWTGV
ncbi:hypothetical protein EPA93_24530 [Ktedonosporobacter rubrisoli]|uniref:DUF3592 domain-containing protein n=1 Tax=Ktedonosporobacter rubrisoli TaxID=2509675 RepID=A0A4P6JTS2_KTERU|nr:hypothetical protein [Ktedonosporobacter rubrisoli]QBD78977.1 hypothetical protein EPA93_24530 [Ktedonosporobacter rubrisoli]